MLLPLNRIFSARITPWLMALGLSPNQVTLLSLGAGLGCAWGFFQGTAAGWFWGALGFQASYLLDNCDGEMARAAGKSSGFGSWLDFLSDWLIHMAFFLSLGFGVKRLDPAGPWAVLGCVATAGVFLAYLTFFLEQVKLRGRSAWFHPDPPGGVPATGFWGRLRKILREDFSLVVLISALAGRMGWLLWGGAMGSCTYWIATVVSIAQVENKGAHA